MIIFSKQDIDNSEIPLEIVNLVRKSSSIENDFEVIDDTDVILM